MRIFGPSWFCQTNPSRLLINFLKYFNNGFEFSQNFKKFDEYAQFLFMYSWICTVSVSVFGDGVKSHSTYSGNMHSKNLFGAYFFVCESPEFNLNPYGYKNVQDSLQEASLSCRTPIGRLGVIYDSQPAELYKSTITNRWKFLLFY
jgi:hypothetical protein